MQLYQKLRHLFSRARHAAFATIFLFQGLLLAGSLHAKDIKGIVKDSNGETLVGVTVMVKGTTNGVITDVEGKYNLKISDKDHTLVFSFIGMKTQEVAIGTKTTINVVLQTDLVSMDEVVVVGYGSVARKDLTGSVSSLKASDLNVGTVSSPDQLLQGKLAGVQISSENGAPGAGVRLNIRGVGSISANSDPLYVIDGVPAGHGGSADGGFKGKSQMTFNPMNGINPADIESIDILKDASAAAIYGAQASNGVILITTKSGRKGGKISYDATFGVSEAAALYDVLNRDEWIEAMTRNNNSLTNRDGGANTNWQKEITRTAYSNSHNVSLSGGNDKTTYFASYNYQTDQGVLQSSQMDKIGLKAKLSQKLYNDKLQIDIDFSKSTINYDNVFVGLNSGSVMKQAIIYNPTQPVYAVEGTESYKRGLVYNEIDAGGARPKFYNPVALVKQIDDNFTTHGFKGIGSAKYLITNNLDVTVRGSYSESSNERRYYIPSTFVENISNNVKGEAGQRWSNSKSELYEAFVNYNKTLNKHNLAGVAGYTYDYNLYSNLQYYGQGFLTDETSYYAISSALKKEGFENSDGEHKIQSYFGRANYNFDNTYYITAILRADQSSNFGKNKQWGYFPSVSLMYRMDKAPVIAGLGFFNLLKLRAGYGVLGNEGIPSYQTKNYNTPTNTAIPLGGQLYNIPKVTVLANPDLQWEETATANAGLDFAVLNNRLSGTVEVYHKYTSNLLFQVDLDAGAPVSKQYRNVGEMKNQGIEFSLDGTLVDTKDWKVNLSGNIAFNHNEVTKLYSDKDVPYGWIFSEGSTGISPCLIRVGESVHSFYAYKFARLGTEEGVDKGFEYFYTKDGKEVINDASLLKPDDRQIVGSADPKFTYGITATVKYKNFDLTAFFRGVGGVSIFNNTALDLGNENRLFTGSNLVKESTPKNIVESPERAYSSKYIEDGSFLRFQTLTLGYNFDAKLKNLSNIRLYVSGQNLFLWSKYSGPDPEVSAEDPGFYYGTIPTQGVDYANYPKPRYITVGLHVEF